MRKSSPRQIGSIETCGVMGRGLPRWRVAFAVLCCSATALANTPGTEEYLDTLTDGFTSVQAWGNLGVNTAAWMSGTTPMALRIGDTVYDRGLGHHGQGEIVIPLHGQYLAFAAQVGVQWQGGSRGSVVFEVWVDGEKRFESGVMTDSTPAQSVDLPLAGAELLRLVASDGGDGITCDMANWANARLYRDGLVPAAGSPLFTTGAMNWDASFAMEGSFALVGSDGGAQLAFVRPLQFCAMLATPGEHAQLLLPLSGLGHPYAIEADVVHAGGALAMVRLTLESGDTVHTALSGGRTTLSVVGDGTSVSDTLTLCVSADQGAAAARLVALRISLDGRALDLNFLPPSLGTGTLPTPREITLNPVLESELLEWDWRMQDGIGCGQPRNSFADAVSLTLDRGDALLAQLCEGDAAPEAVATAWAALRPAYNALRAADLADDADEWEELWRSVHESRRGLLFAHPAADKGPLVFAKQVPGVFSHQLTQYYGRYARPGGGVYVLEAPGTAMGVRKLGTDALPQGSFMQPEVTHDGQRVLVAFCALDTPPEDSIHGVQGRHYHLYEMAVDGSGARRLTEGPYDDFAPVELPDGDIMFISTRRGGWHRCGSPGCEVYTLTRMRPDGDDIRVVSFHETQEWDPAVLNDGRIVYTRWDYVDRDAVHYQHLWSVHPDGAAPAAFYGNHTLNPVGVWEPRAIPGSHKIMATAAAHHAMTAGSIILVDRTVGVDELEPLTRLTPHVPFPESEDTLLPHWRTAIAYEPPEQTPEMMRWPGQCYRSPWPLSEELFFAAYSFDPLIGEPLGNPANMFGLYLADAFGNKELLYRDLNIASLWPMPIAARTPAPALPSILDPDATDEGSYFLQDVYQSYPPLPPGSVSRLRIVQVLPKSTPVANTPTLGAPNASPGKQVLGTVPVESDGSAYFRAPSGIALSFQALDEKGRAVQIMRSISYLQPGENASCVGCHESRQDAPPTRAVAPHALQRAPSAIEPGPDGSLPFSYPLLVQPVLDRHCIQCHGDERSEGPEGGAPVRLTGAPEGRYTESYNALVSRVSYSAWGRGPFPDGNSEPLTQPGFFGAKGSALMDMLLAGHQEVALNDDDLDRLITWIDANALFYGTFNFENQERQQRGERIPGPDIE